MVESKGALVYKLWIFVIGVLIIGNVILLSSRNVNRPPDPVVNTSDNPNAVNRAMVLAAHETGHGIALTGYKLSSSTRSIAASTSHSISHADKTVLNGIAAIGHGIGHGVSGVASVGKGVGHLLGHGVTSSLAFTMHTVGHVFSIIPNPLDINAVIRPADGYRLPVIVPVPTLVARPVVQTASQPATPTGSQPDSSAQWPIHGAITTLFGVPELPYERIHTGLDISDGKAPGTTPIKPYKSGVVSQVIRSYSGLGNHIVIDNGGGITSVYGHLNSIAVAVGQRVDQNTVLGFEGTTGASTGTHLHFEIRVNGAPVNPLLYISGRP